MGLLAGHLVEHKRPTTVDALTRTDVEAFLAHLLERYKPNTAANRYRLFRRSSSGCRGGGIDESPMKNMRPPHVPDVPVPVLSTDELKRLLKTCEGKDFEERRDMAIVRLLADGELRRGEVAGLGVNAVDWDQEVVVVVGKGSRPRAVPFGKKTAVALDRYLRARSAHKHAHLDAFWLAQRGAVTNSGILQIEERSSGRTSRD